MFWKLFSGFKAKFVLSLFFILTVIFSAVVFSLKDTCIFIDGAHGNYGLFALPLSGRYQICWSEDSQRISTNAEDLKKFDVIIIGGVPINDAYGLSFEQVSAIISYVKNGGSLLLVGGQYSYKAGNWDTSPFYDLLPVMVDDDDGFRQVTVKSFMSEEFLGAHDGQVCEIQFYGFHRLKPKEDSQVLLKSGDGYPLFVVRQFGKGKVGALAVFDVDTSNGYDLALLFYPTLMAHLVTRDVPFNWIIITTFVLVSCSVIIAFIFLTSKTGEEAPSVSNDGELTSIWHHLGIILTLAVPCLILVRGWFSDGLPGQFEAAFYYGAVASLRKAFFSGNLWHGWLSDIWLGSPIFSRNYPWYYAELPYLLVAIFVGELWAFKIVSLFWLILGGWGIYKVGRQLNLSYAGALTAAVIYQFWGLIQVEMFQLGFVEIFTVYFLAPFAFLYLLRIMDKPSILNGILLGVFLGWMFLCRMEIATYFTIGFMIYCFIHLRFDKQWFMKRLFHFGISIILIVLFLSIWLIPYLTEQQMISRFTFKYEESLPFSSSGILALMGRSHGGYNPIPHTVPAYNPWITALSLLPLSLAVLTIVRRKNRLTLALGAIMLFSILFAMGPYSPIPVFKFMHTYFPLMNSVRTPGRFLLAYALPVALLAGNAIAIIENDLKHIKIPKNLNSLRFLSKHIPALFVASLLLISIEAMVAPLSGAQFKSIPVPKDTERAFELMEKDSIILEIPPSAWPKIPGYHKNTYVQNMMFSSILHRYLSSAYEIISVTGITASQHAPAATLSYVNLLDYYISIGDVDSFMKTVELVPGIKYLLVNNNWVNREVIEKLTQYPTVKTVYQSENVTLLTRTNCVEGIYVCDNPAFAYIGTSKSVTEIYDKIKQPIVFYHDNPEVWFNLAIASKSIIALESNISDLITETILRQKGIILQAENYVTSLDPYQGWVTSSVFQPAQNGASAGTWSNQTLKVPFDSDGGVYEVFLRIYFHSSRGKLKIQVNNATPFEIQPLGSEGFEWIRVGKFELAKRGNILSITNDGSSANDVDAVGYILTKTMEEEYVKVSSQITSFLENGGRIIKIGEFESDELPQNAKTSGKLIYLSQSFSDGWKLSCEKAVPLKVNGLLMGWWIQDYDTLHEIKVIPQLRPLAVLLNLIPFLAIILLIIGHYCPKIPLKG